MPATTRPMPIAANVPATAWPRIAGSTVSGVSLDTPHIIPATSSATMGGGNLQFQRMLLRLLSTGIGRALVFGSASTRFIVDSHSPPTTIPKLHDALTSVNKGTVSSLFQSAFLAGTYPYRATGSYGRGVSGYRASRPVFSLPARGHPPAAEKPRRQYVLEPLPLFRLRRRR